MAKDIVNAYLIGQKIITENSDEALELYNQSRFGAIEEEKKLQLSLIEAVYLLEKKRLAVLDNKDNEIKKVSLIRKCIKLEPNFWARYLVFKDIRDRGYIIKTALKFGAEFRIYDRGVKPGEDHAKWIVYPVLEGQTITWHDFSAKNRVAHSTKKKLLIGVVDEEKDITYYEIRWVRP